jgi:hypothetical protein
LHFGSIFGESSLPAANDLAVYHDDVQWWASAELGRPLRVRDIQDHLRLAGVANEILVVALQQEQRWRWRVCRIG